MLQQSCFRRGVSAPIVLSVLLTARTVQAQPLVPVPPYVPPAAPAAPAAPVGPWAPVAPVAPPTDLGLGPFQEIVRGIVLEELKEQYDDNDDWGRQVSVQKYHLRGKGFNAWWEPYTTQVNDGLWQRATIRPVDPERNLTIQLIPEPSADKDRSAFVLVVAAKIEGEVQAVRWRMGVKMLNGTVRFDAALEAQIRCDLAIHQKGGLLGDVVLDPRVTAVDLKLKDFNLQQLGILGRDIARELSGPVEPFVARALDKREAKIVGKINAAIAKRRDKLRFSPTEYVLSRWSKLTSAIGESASSGAAPK